MTEVSPSDQDSCLWRTAAPDQIVPEVSAFLRSPLSLHMVRLLVVLEPGLPDGIASHEFMAASPQRVALLMNSLVERAPASRTAARDWRSIFITLLSAHLVSGLLPLSCPIYPG